MADDPGLVQVADQAFDGLAVQVPDGIDIPASTPVLVVDADLGNPVIGDISPNQPVTVTPQTTPVLVLDGDDGKPGIGPIEPNQPVIVEETNVSLVQTQGGDFDPIHGQVEEVITNNVVQQVYGGPGLPANVFV